MLVPIMPAHAQVPAQFYMGLYFISSLNCMICHNVSKISQEYLIITGPTILHAIESAVKYYTGIPQ